MTSHILERLPAALSRRSLLGLAAFATLAAGLSVAAAAGAGKFTASALETAQKAGKTDPRRNFSAMVSHLQGAEANFGRTRREGQVQGPRQIGCRL